MMPKDEVQGRFATDQLVVMCVLLPVEQRVLFYSVLLRVLIKS